MLYIKCFQQHATDVVKKNKNKKTFVQQSATCTQWFALILQSVPGSMHVEAIMQFSACIFIGGDSSYRTPNKQTFNNHRNADRCSRNTCTAKKLQILVSKKGCIVVCPTRAHHAHSRHSFTCGQINQLYKTLNSLLPISGLKSAYEIVSRRYSARIPGALRVSNRQHFATQTNISYSISSFSLLLFLSIWYLLNIQLCVFHCSDSLFLSPAKPYIVCRDSTASGDWRKLKHTGSSQTSSWCWSLAQNQLRGRGSISERQPESPGGPGRQAGSHKGTFVWLSVPGRSSPRRQRHRSLSRYSLHLAPSPDNCE